MTRLIDADYLSEKVMVIGKQPMPDIRTKKDLEQAGTNFYHTFLNLITNAPAIEQGEPMGRLEITKDEFGFYFYYSLPHTVEGSFGEVANAIAQDAWMQSLGVGKLSLYAAPPQPQSVKDALKKAINICEELCNQHKDQYIDAALRDCAVRIRALIEKE